MIRRPWKCDQEGILAAYDAGENTRIIAERFGCCRSYVSLLAKRRGRVLRRPEEWRLEMRLAQIERLKEEREIA